MHSVMKSFKRWAIENRELYGDSPEGDFIADMKRDKKFPRKSDHASLINHLHASGCCHLAFKAFAKVHSDWMVEVVAKKPDNKACHLRSQSNRP